MGSAVTITPDAPAVTITPDAEAAPKPSWMDKAIDFGKGIWEKVNPVSNIQGAAQLTAHPINSYVADAGNRQDLMNKAEDAFKKGNYAEGAAHMLYGVIPFLGPQMDQAGTNIQQGQVAKGLGQSVGMGLNLSTPALVKGAGAAANAIPGAADAADALSQRLYKSALKPSTTLAPAKVASAVQTGLQSEIPVSAGGLEKLGDLIDDMNAKIKAQIAASPNKPISTFGVASRLGDTADTFKNQVNPAADLAAVQKSGTEFMNSQPPQMNAVDAQALKQGTYQQLKSRAYGELGTATVESQKALARGIKEELANAFPGINDLNAADSKLIGLNDVLERAVSRISNHQMMGIGTPLAAAGAKAVTGSSGVAGIAGMLKAVVDDPFVKSKLAIALSKASNGQIPLPTAIAKVGAYSNALGSAANSPAPDGQGNQ